jgi:hypothetical protein
VSQPIRFEAVMIWASKWEIWNRADNSAAYRPIFQENPETLLVTCVGSVAPENH